MICIEVDVFLGYGVRNIGKGFLVYLILIECLEDVFEVMFDLKTTLIEFENWNTVFFVFRKVCVNEYVWLICDDFLNDDLLLNMNLVVDLLRNWCKMSEWG